MKKIRKAGTCLFLAIWVGMMMTACAGTDKKDTGTVSDAGTVSKEETVSEAETVSETETADIGKFAIIHTNDTHGQDIRTEATEDAPGVLGMASVAQLKKDYEEKGYQVLLLDAGDASQGTTLVNLSKGANAFSFMNEAGYQGMVAGNHEFDWGADNLSANCSQADFPVLGANVIVKEDGSPFLDQNVVLTMKDGTKVGIFGLVTPETLTSTNPKNVAGLQFLSGQELYQCAQEQIDILNKQGCSMIICLGHLGTDEKSRPDCSVDVINNTKGIDVFIDGHSHSVVSDTINGTLLVSTGEKFENAGIVLYENGTFQTESVNTETYKGTDKKLADRIAVEEDKVLETMSEIIGETKVFLNGERDPGCRTEETNLGDFAADALLWQARQVFGDEVDGAITNGGGIRASVSAGSITMDNLYTVFPYENYVTVVTVTGNELLEILEASACALPDAAGAFAQVSGIEYTVDTTVPYENGAMYPDSTYYAPAKAGSRVTINSIGGKKFNPGTEYTIASSNYLTDGGDTYYVFSQAYARKGRTTGILMSDSLINYLKTECLGVIGTDYENPKKRIEIIK